MSENEMECEGEGWEGWGGVVGLAGERAASEARPRDNE